MIATPHDRSRARSRRAAAGRAAVGAAVLVVLLAGLPALRAAPAAPGAVRVGGISIEWWYGGLLAPAAGWLVAVWAIKTPRAAASDTARPAPGDIAAGASPDSG